MIALKECYSEVLWFIMVEMRRGVFCFIFSIILYIIPHGDTHHFAVEIVEGE